MTFSHWRRKLAVTVAGTTAVLGWLPAGAGQATPTGTGQATSAAAGQATPTGTGQATPTGTGQATSVGSGPATPIAAGRIALDAAPAWTAQAQAVGPSKRDAQVALTAVLPLRDETGAHRLALAVSTPGSTQYRRYVTAAQWRDRFAPSSATVDAVRSWLTASGFTITAVPANRRYVAFRGTVATADAAFGVRLTDYVKDGARTSAPSAPVAVPAALAGKVVGIGGLDGSARVRPGTSGSPATGKTATPKTATGKTETSKTGTGKTATGKTGTSKTGTGKNRSETLPPPGALFRNAPPCSAYFGEKIAAAAPDFDGVKQPYAVCGYLPAQIRSAYGTQPALDAGMDGRGATVAVVDAYASPTILADSQTYAQRNDPRHPMRSSQLRQVLPATYSLQSECSAAGWYSEETLDIEAVHAVAPGAGIVYVGTESCAETAITAAVNTIVDDELAQVISNSYGLQGDVSPADATAEHESYLQAAAEGISVLFSSGDSGDDIAATGTRQTTYSASDPFVTAVGGTSLKVAQDGSYLGETGWGTSKSTQDNSTWTPGTFLYGGGGGTSKFWSQPTYQQGVVPRSIAYYGGAADPGRAVPDLAADGDPNTGLLIGQTQTFPDGSPHYSEYRIGGTSLAAPLLAGLQAVANQIAGMPLGFLNPRLYQLAGTDAYHDVADVNRPDGAQVRVDYVNSHDATDGTVTTLRTLADTGTIYTRGGYDDVTGLGTPNGVAYLTAVSGHPLP